MSQVNIIYNQWCNAITYKDASSQSQSAMAVQTDQGNHIGIKYCGNYGRHKERVFIKHFLVYTQMTN